MTLNLQKGHSALLKGDQKTTKGTVGLGWNPRGNGDAFDLDAILISRDASGNTVEDGVCFFNNLDVGWAKHSGDSITGEGEVNPFGDDEQIFINLSGVPANVNSIDLVVIMYEAAKRSQSFGDLSKAHVRLHNEDTGQEVCRFDLTGDQYFSETGMCLAQLIRRGPTWEFRASGIGGNAFKDLATALATPNPVQ